MSYNMRYDA